MAKDIRNKIIIPKSARKILRVMVKVINPVSQDSKSPVTRSIIPIRKNRINTSQNLAPNLNIVGRIKIFIKTTPAAKYNKLYRLSARLKSPASPRGLNIK